MLVRILRQCATPYGLFEEGNITEIPDEDARKWVKSGLAESVTGDVTPTTNVTQNKPTTEGVTHSMGDVTPVTDPKEKKRQQTRDRVRKCRASKKGASNEI